MATVSECLIIGFSVRKLATLITCIGNLNQGGASGISSPNIMRCFTAEAYNFHYTNYFQVVDVDLINIIMLA